LGYHAIRINLGYHAIRITWRRNVHNNLDFLLKQTS
jgi:hypothetical protein